MRRPGRYIALFSMLFCLSCATTQERLAAPQDGASLEVENRYNTELEISVDGWMVGSVPAAGRVRFRNLRPGERSLEADGRDVSVRENRLLVSGRIMIWSIAPDVDAVPAPPDFGALTLHNRTSRDLEVIIADQQHTMLAGDSKTLPDVFAGVHPVVVQVPGARYQRTLSVDVRPSETTTVDLPLETAKVELVNRTREPVQLELDGKLVGGTEHGSSLLVEDILVGTHRLMAFGTRTGRKYRRQVVLELDSKLEWDLTAASGKVTIDNATGETLRLKLGDTDRGELANGKQLVIDDARLGIRVVTAMGQSTGHRWSSSIAVVAGQSTTWTVRDDVGTMLITNQRPEPVEIRAGGTLLARLAPGAQRFFDNLRRDVTRIEVFGLTSKDLRAYELELTPAESVQLVLDAPEGRLHVRNRTPEAMLVYVQSRPVGRVEAESAMVFTQVPPGEHRVEARGVTTGNIVRGRVPVAADALVVWDVENATGTLSIHNTTGERVLLPPSLGGKALEPDDRADFVVPVGHRAFKLVGAQTGQTYGTRRHIMEGVTSEWVIPRLVGTIHVFNRTTEGWSVRVDGGEPKAVAPGRTEVLELPVGPHRLVATGTSSGDAAETTIVVRSKGVHPFQLRAPLAKFRVDNNTPEVLDLRVNGAPLGWVQPGARRVYEGWAPGTYTLEAQGRRTHAIQEVKVQLLGNRLETWTVLPPEGAVLVHNQRPESVRILLDSKELGTVDAESSRRLELSTGKHFVEIVGAESKKHFRFRIDVQVDRTITLTAPHGPAALHVFNTLPVSVTLHLGDRNLGTVKPGEDMELPVHERGVLEFIATEEASGLTFHRRLKFIDDRVQVWRLAR